MNTFEITPEKLSFATKIQGFNMPVNIDKNVLRASREGVMRQFWKDQYKFQILDDGTEERELYRLRLKKLRKIANDINKVLRINI